MHGGKIHNLDRKGYQVTNYFHAHANSMLAVFIKLPENEANKTRSAVSGNEMGRSIALGED